MQSNSWIIPEKHLILPSQRGENQSIEAEIEVLL